MSKASELRRRRQLIRRIGQTKTIPPFIVGVVTTPNEVFIHYRNALPVVIKREQLDYDGKFDERLALGGFIKQTEWPVWFHREATLVDVLRMCDMKVVGAPVLKFMGIQLTPKTIVRQQDFSS